MQDLKSMPHVLLVVCRHLSRVFCPLCYVSSLPEDGKGIWFVFRSGCLCMILESWRHISLRMPAWVFLHVCKCLQFSLLRFLNPALEPLPLACSHLLQHTSFLLRKKKKTQTKINKQKVKEPNWKTYLLWSSFFTQRCKQNQCSKKATDFLCSISQVNHDHWAWLALFSFNEREGVETEREK